MDEITKILLMIAGTTAVIIISALFVWIFYKVMDWLTDEPIITIDNRNYRKSSFVCKHPNDEKYKNSKRMICNQSCLYCKYNPKNNK